MNVRVILAFIYLNLPLVIGGLMLGVYFLETKIKEFLGYEQNS